MNRRAYLKNILLLGALGTASIPVFKWVKLNQPVAPVDLFKKRETIAELVDLIIPATDTPGAKEAGVHNYVINVLLNCRAAKDQERFLHGIEDLEKYAVSKYQKDFIKCSQTEKTEILQHIAESETYKINILNKINNKLLGQSFFSNLKGLTVQGYCISSLGATKGLAYDYIPGKYEACIPLLKNQRSWATK